MTGFVWDADSGTGDAGMIQDSQHHVVTPLWKRESQFYIRKAFVQGCQQEGVGKHDHVWNLCLKWCQRSREHHHSRPSKKSEDDSRIHGDRNRCYHHLGRHWMKTLCRTASLACLSLRHPWPRESRREGERHKRIWQPASEGERFFETRPSTINSVCPANTARFQNDDANARWDERGRRRRCCCCCANLTERIKLLTYDSLFFFFSFILSSWDVLSVLGTGPGARRHLVATNIYPGCRPSVHSLFFSGIMMPITMVLMPASCKNNANSSPDDSSIFGILDAGIL